MLWADGCRAAADLWRGRTAPCPAHRVKRLLSAYGTISHRAPGGGRLVLVGPEPAVYSPPFMDLPRTHEPQQTVALGLGPEGDERVASRDVRLTLECNKLLLGIVDLGLDA